MGWSNLILDPTLALIRAQLGFRIQVPAECGNIDFHYKMFLEGQYKMLATQGADVAVFNLWLELMTVPARLLDRYLLKVQVYYIYYRGRLKTYST